VCSNLHPAKYAIFKLVKPSLGNETASSETSRTSSYTWSGLKILNVSAQKGIKKSMQKPAICSTKLLHRFEAPVTAMSLEFTCCDASAPHGAGVDCEG